MLDLIPELRRVRPEKYLNTGPDLSSSHCRQLLSDPSGLLKGSFVIQAYIHVLKQS